MRQILETTHLEFRQGNSDKEYNLSLERLGGASAYAVYATYGRRGSANQIARIVENATYDEAFTAFTKQKNSKLSKGYQETQSTKSYPGAVTNQTFIAKEKVADERVVTDLRPQLLNPIKETEMEQYLADDAYLVQEKLDGKRIMVRVGFGEVTASNRRSWVVNIPQNIVDELAKLEDCTLDGELLGDSYCVFDILEHRGVDLRSKPYDYRFEVLANIIGNNVLDYIDLVPTAYGAEDKCKLVNSLLHKEGVVFKLRNAASTPGRPNSGGTQLKCKFWSSATCVVTAVNDKRSVAISVDSPDGFVPVGNVTVPPNYDMPQSGDCVEVKYLYYYVGGSLYQPQYLGVRDDVDPDVVSSLKPKSEDSDE